MTWQDKAFLAFYFLVVLIVQAVWQARLFKANKPISHLRHSVYYLLTILPMIYFFSPWWWKVVVIGVVTRLAWFDITLNLIRGKRPLLTYNGRGTTGSKIDQWENRFSTTWLTVLKLLYIAVFILTLIFIK